MNIEERAAALATDVCGYPVTVALKPRLYRDGDRLNGKATWNGGVNPHIDLRYGVDFASVLAHEIGHLALKHFPRVAYSEREMATLVDKQEWEADQFRDRFLPEFEKRYGYSLEEYLFGRGPVIKTVVQGAEKATGLATYGSEVISYGSEVKALPNGKLAGFLVRFTDENHPDLTNDFFTADSQLDFEDGDKTTVYYNHGQDETLGKRKLAVGTLTRTTAGVWVQTQLAMRDDFEAAIYAMAKAGKLGWSSGAPAHLVERERVGKAMWIKSWPLGKDASLTPTPAAGLDLTDVVAKSLSATADKAFTPERIHRPTSNTMKWYRKHSSMNRS